MEKIDSTEILIQSELENVETPIVDASKKFKIVLPKFELIRKKFKIYIPQLIIGRVIWQHKFVHVVRGNYTESGADEYVVSTTKFGDVKITKIE